MGSRERDRGAGAPGVVVVGAGQAGATLTTVLRRRGYAEPVTLVGAEPGPPYERPPLSKGYLAGDVRERDLLLDPAEAYDDSGIALLAGDPAVAVDRDRRVVRTASGRDLPYAHLVLAVGAEPRRLAVPGAHLDGVRVLRTLADARELRRRLADARHPVVVGAGFVGMEVAAVAAGGGRPVTVVEALDRPHARLVTPAVSAAVIRKHEARGTRLELGAAVTALGDDGRGRVASVVLADGRELPADLVLVGIGVTARTELAVAAGLDVDDATGGISVDAHLRTPDPRVSAVGDCASYPSAHLGGRRVRVESVQNAVDQATAVAVGLTGVPTPYTAVPWFWSDQFDLHLQIAGLAEGRDERLLLGDPASGAFSVLCFRGEELVAVESVSRPADHLAARKLLAAGARLDPATAAAPGFDLKSHLAALRRASALTDHPRRTTACRTP